MTRVDRAKEFRAAASLAAQGATDAQAATMPTMYDLWAPWVAYGGEGQPSIVRRPDGQLYRIRQAHTSQIGWEPENVPAIWAAIDKSHAGTAADPIPAVRGDVAVRYGYQRFRPDIMIYTVIILIVMVQLIQMLGDFAYKRLKK